MTFDEKVNAAREAITSLQTAERCAASLELYEEAGKMKDVREAIERTSLCSLGFGPKENTQ